MRFSKTSELVLSSLSLIHHFKQARKAAALASSPSFSPCPQNVLLLSSIPPAEGDAAHVLSFAPGLYLQSFGGGENPSAQA